MLWRGQWPYRTEKCVIMTSVGLQASPRSVVQVTDYPPGAVFGPRRTTNFEFVWLLRGSARLTLLEDSHDGSPGVAHSHVLEPGVLLLTRPGMTDTYHWDSASGTAHAYVHFDVELPASHEETSSWPLLRPMLGNPPLEGLCSYLLSLAGMDHPGARARSDQVVGMLLDIFVNGPLPGEVQSRLQPRLMPAVDHVRAAWAADGLRIVSVEELARAAGLSAGHCSRLFSQEFSCGPVAALEMVRLARAATLLLRSELALQDIASLCGFGDGYHFSHRFAGLYGLPPGRYRRRGMPTDAHWPLARPELMPLWRALGPSAGPVHSGPGGTW